jgi:pre-rRNA-processing protein TSR1
VLRHILCLQRGSVRSSIALHYCSDLRIERFKQSLQYLTPLSSTVEDILDTCLPADYILLLLSSTVNVPESSLNILRAILSQGTPSIIPMVANLMAHSNPKTRAEVKKSLLTYIQQYVPTVKRVFAADEHSDASSVLRTVCNGVPSGIRWREQRSYILPEGWRWDEEEEKVVFWGTVRGKPLHVDRLLNLGSWRDFQIEKVHFN